MSKFKWCVALLAIAFAGCTSSGSDSDGNPGVAVVSDEIAILGQDMTPPTVGDILPEEEIEPSALASTNLADDMLPPVL